MRQVYWNVLLKSYRRKTSLKSKVKTGEIAGILPKTDHIPKDKPRKSKPRKES